MIKTLKALSAINNGIVLDKGETLHTIAPDSSIYATTTETKAPFSFGIYDLNSFLSTLSLTSDDRDIKVDGVMMEIVDKNVKLKYTGAVEELIMTPPDDVSPLTSLPECNEFTLSQDNMKQLVQASSVMGAEKIKFTWSDGKVDITTVTDNDNAYSLEIESNVDDEKSAEMIADKLKTMVIDDYTVTVSDKAIIFKSNDIVYYVVRSDI